jgi:hypothetical protein
MARKSLYFFSASLFRLKQEVDGPEITTFLRNGNVEMVRHKEHNQIGFFMRESASLKSVFKTYVRK